MGKTTIRERRAFGKKQTSEADSMLALARFNKRQAQGNRLSKSERKARDAAAHMFGWND